MADITLTIGAHLQAWRPASMLPRWTAQPYSPRWTVTGGLMINRSVLTTEYLSYPVTFISGGVSQNPTADTVQFAFMPNPANANPGTGDWHNGVWSTTSVPTYIAQILVGPGGYTPGAGLYNVWIKITDNPEIPIQQIDTLQLT